MRPDLVGMTVTSADGHIATVNGTPAEDTELTLQWCYRDAMMITTLPANLTAARVRVELETRMGVIDIATSLAGLVREEL